MNKLSDLELFELQSLADNLNLGSNKFNWFNTIKIKEIGGEVEYKVISDEQENFFIIHDFLVFRVTVDKIIELEELEKLSILAQNDKL